MRQGTATAAGWITGAAAILLPVTAAPAGGLDWLPTDWQAGGMVVVTPKYEGSSRYRVLGFPLLFPAGREDVDGRIQFKGLDDIRVRAIEAGGFELGPFAGWRFGRDEEDGDRLVGLGDVDGGLVLGAYGAYRTGPFAAFVSYGHQASGADAGGLLRFGLESKARVQPWLYLSAVVGATWASADYMDAYFSVSPLQSARSGLTAFDADAGIKDVHVGLTAAIPLDDRWTLRMTGRYTHLVGDAADSPIVERESQLTGGLGLTYRFSTR